MYIIILVTYLMRNRFIILRSTKMYKDSYKGNKDKAFAINLIQNVVKFMQTKDTSRKK